MAISLGIDTSCYTTSAAVAREGEILSSARRMITVEKGSRGTQQSNIVFQHTGRLADVVKSAVDEAEVAGQMITSVCASVKPRPVEGSYMPVFTVGEGYGKAIAAALGVPFIPTTHQEGHLRAALVDSGLSGEGGYIALHLSGGTSEVLAVGDGSITLLGGTLDIHAGQLVDRTGVMMGFDFPSGPAMEAAAEEYEAQSLIPASVDGLNCHFSGAEACAKRMYESGKYPPGAIAAEVYSAIARTVAALTANAAAANGAARVLYFGGIASSKRFRRLVEELLKSSGGGIAAHWGRPGLSGDNAAGVALIGCATSAKE